MANLISLNQVKHIAKLANLSLTEAEVEKFQSQLSGILSYIDKLKELNTNNIKETNQVTGLVNVLRQDEEINDRSLTQEEALKNAAKTYKGYFVVPAVIEKE